MYSLTRFDCIYMHTYIHTYIHTYADLHVHSVLTPSYLPCFDSFCSLAMQEWKDEVFARLYASPSMPSSTYSSTIWSGSIHFPEQKVCIPACKYMRTYVECLGTSVM